MHSILRQKNHIERIEKALDEEIRKMKDVDESSSLIVSINLLILNLVWMIDSFLSTSILN